MNSSSWDYRLGDLDLDLVGNVGYNCLGPLCMFGRGGGALGIWRGPWFSGWRLISSAAFSSKVKAGLGKK